MSKSAFSKTEIENKITAALSVEPAVLAMWIGGSAATGFEDELSDTDLVAICENPGTVFEIIENSLSSISQIWTVEESIWKGFTQKFYILSEGPRTYYLDIGVFQSKEPEDYQEFFNISRHGRAIILLDRENILKTASLAPRVVTPPAVDLPQWRARFEVIYRTFLKEALRGKYIDSFIFYQRLVLMWVQLLRYTKTPEKYDFGLRYIYRDFSQSDAVEIESYLQVNSLRDLKIQAERLRQQALEFLKTKGLL